MLQNNFIRAVKCSSLGLDYKHLLPKKEVTRKPRAKKSKAIVDEVRKIVDENNIENKPLEDVKKELTQELKDEKKKLKHIKKKLIDSIQSSPEEDKADDEKEEDVIPKPQPKKKRLSRAELREKKEKLEVLVEEEIKKLDSSKPIEDTIQDIEVEEKKINIFKNTLSDL